MKQARKICFIPFWGSILCFFYTVFTLRKYNKYKVGKSLLYMIAIGLCGGVGMVITVNIWQLLGIESEGNVLAFILSWFILWPLITIPVVNYSKYAESILEEKDNS